MERSFFENGGVERAPADGLAVGYEAVIGAERATVRLSYCKD
jgi:hypothetical protein